MRGLFGIGRRGRVPAWLIPLAAFDVVMRAVAGRRAWRNQQPAWALALAVVNSAGILPLLYLLYFQRPPASRAGEAAGPLHNLP